MWNRADDGMAIEQSDGAVGADGVRSKGDHEDLHMNRGEHTPALVSIIDSSFRINPFAHDGLDVLEMRTHPPRPLGIAGFVPLGGFRNV